VARDAIALSVGSAERRSHWENVYATKVEDEASLFRKTRPAAQSRIALRSPKKSRRVTHRRREIETPLGDDALVPQVGLGRSDPPHVARLVATGKGASTTVLELLTERLDVGGRNGGAKQVASVRRLF
jgi:hypothetical protein